MLIQGTLMKLPQWNKVMEVGRGLVEKVSSRRKRMKKRGWGADM